MAGARISPGVHWINVAPRRMSELSASALQNSTAERTIMAAKTNGPELERLRDERDNLWVKLSLAQESCLHDADKIGRLQRSLELVDKAIDNRMRKT